MQLLTAGYCATLATHTPLQTSPPTPYTPLPVQVMSADSLPAELYQAICAFNSDLLAQSAGGRTLLVQRLAELVRVRAVQTIAVQRSAEQRSAVRCIPGLLLPPLAAAVCDAAAAAIL